MATYIIGDLHGHYRDYKRLLQTSGLCDENLNWIGGDSTLWLMGDFFDRGSSGIQCLDLTMSLQTCAKPHGGSVNALLGNHELMILCAYQFKDADTGRGGTVLDQWLMWGGRQADLQAFNESHATWIKQLPAMAREAHALLIHADAMLYVDHGTSVDKVNSSFSALMSSEDLDQWQRTLGAFSEHMAFSALSLTGTRRVEQLLSRYGGDLLIHGHTPIAYAQQVEPASVTGAWYYANRRCVNVDSGMYMGGPGFVYQLN